MPSANICFTFGDYFRPPNYRLRSVPSAVSAGARLIRASISTCLFAPDRLLRLNVTTLDCWNVYPPHSTFQQVPRPKSRRTSWHGNTATA
jgi:hypothetical protein